MDLEKWKAWKQRQMDSAVNRKIKAESEIAKIRFQLHNTEKSYAKYLNQRKRNQGKTIPSTEVSGSKPQKEEIEQNKDQLDITHYC